jgi:urease beta subunit
VSDLVERLRKDADNPSYMAGDGFNWCEVEDKELLNAADRIEALEAALDLALGYLVQFEPGDSRAVSDEFVAMASVLANIKDSRSQECLDIIAVASNALKDK